MAISLILANLSGTGISSMYLAPPSNNAALMHDLSLVPERVIIKDPYVRKATQLIESLIPRIDSIMSAFRSDPKNLDHPDRKADGSALTNCDLAIQSLVIKAVHTRYPEHHFIAEEKNLPEYLKADKNSEHIWVMDPIDGTEIFSSSDAALKKDGKKPGEYAFGITLLKKDQYTGLYEVQLCIEYAPELKLQKQQGFLFEAIKGIQGILVNNKIVAPVNKRLSTISRTAVIDPWYPDEQVDELEKLLLKHSFDISKITSCSHIQAIQTIIGKKKDRLTVAINTKPAIWDVLPGAVIALKGGGQVRFMNGKPILHKDAQGELFVDIWGNMNPSTFQMPSEICGSEKALDFIFDKANIEINKKEDFIHSDILSELPEAQDSKIGFSFKTPRKGRRIDIEKRKQQIQTIITIYGGVVTDIEIAAMLGITVKQLKKWAHKPDVGLNLEKLGVISASKINIIGNYIKKGKKNYLKAEPLCKYYIFKIMLIHMALLNLTARNTFLNKKSHSLGLKKEEARELALIHLGFDNITKRLKNIKIKIPDFTLMKTGMRNYREHAKEMIQTATEMLERNLRPAANTALISCVVNGLSAELDWLTGKRWENKKKRFITLPRSRIKSRIHYYLRQGRFKGIPVEGNAIPLLVYENTPYDIRWKAFQAVDHINDSEINEISSINDYLECIQRIEQKISGAKRGWLFLTISERLLFVEELKSIIDEIKPQWIIEKFFVKTALQIAVKLIETNAVRNNEELTFVDLDENVLLGNANELLGMARGFLERRKAECEHIIEGVEYGNLNALRISVIQQNTEISESIENIFKNIKNDRFKTARIWALGLSKRHDINHEPEFEGLAPIFGRIASALQKKPAGKKRKEINYLIDYARARMYEVRLLGVFMKDFRNAYKKARIEENQPEECRESVFTETYEQFAKNNPYVRNAPHLRSRFFLAALMKLEIIDPLNAKEKIDNPAFKVISFISRLHYFRSLEDAIAYFPELNQHKYNDIKATFKEYIRQDKNSLHMLTEKDRKRIVDLLIADIYLLLIEKPLIIKQKSTIENALNAFLKPKSTDSSEISDTILKTMRDNANKIQQLLAQRTKTNITQAKNLNAKSITFLSHVSQPASSDTIIQKLRAIKSYLSGRLIQRTNASEKAEQLVRQISDILRIRNRAEQHFNPSKSKTINAISKNEPQKSN